MPINHCLGGKDFIDFHWCDDIRKGNEKLNFVDSVGDSTRLMQAYIMKKSQPYFDDLPDIAVIMVSQCTEKYQTDLSRQTSCINEATKEFISRANTCSGMPTKPGSLKTKELLVAHFVEDLSRIQLKPPLLKFQLLCQPQIG